MLKISHENTFYFLICAQEICEKFVYKHLETIEKLAFFKKFTNFTSKSALVYRYSSS